MVSAIDSAKAYPVSAIYFYLLYCISFFSPSDACFLRNFKVSFQLQNNLLNFMIYSIPKYINNLKSQKIKFVKLNIHVPYLDAKFTTAKNSSYMYMYGYC